MGQTILILGATGTVGSELARQLAGAGQAFRILARSPEKLAGFGSGIEVVAGNLAQPATLSEAFRGVKKVFVVAPPTPELEMLEANAFAAAEQAGAEHIVYLSNFGAGALDGDLWRAHGANERRLRASSMAWTILRPVRFMSNIPYGWAAIRDGGLLLEPLGGRKVTMIDPRDIAAVAFAALREPHHEGKLYELVGEALSGNDMALCLSRALGRPIRFIDAPEDNVRADLIRSGFPAALAETVLTYFAMLRAGHWYETTTLAEVLGRRPLRFEEWLAGNSGPLTARVRS